MRQFRIPSPRLHVPSGRARVRFRGKDHYLGQWGDPEIPARFERLVAELIATQGNGRPAQRVVTLESLSACHLDYAATYYVKHGQPTRQLEMLRITVRELLALFPAIMARDFGPLKLKDFRAHLMREQSRKLKSGGLKTWRRSRCTVNAMTRLVVQMFQWGVGEELVANDVWQALTAVKPLAAGRCGLAEPAEREPVPDAVILKTLPWLMGSVAAMVQLQLLSNARPGEICILRPCDVDRDADKHEGCWLYWPAHHKTEHVTKKKGIALGPRAQAVLAPFLQRPAGDYCFQPEEAYREYLERRAAARMTPASCGNRPGKRAGGLAGGRKFQPCYDRNSYCRAVIRACRLAGVDPWTPHQLRHTRSTQLWDEVSPEAARATAGHKKLNMTKLYAHADAKLACRTMAKVG